MSEMEREQVIEEVVTETIEAETTATEDAEEAVEVSEVKQPQKAESKSWLSTWYELMGNVAVALIIVTVLFSFCFRQVVVDGASMNDTLAHGDRLLLQTMFYSVERGDIVVVYQEKYPQKPLIKRVIATGGDTLMLKPNANNGMGEVYLKKAGENDLELLDEPYVHYPLTWGISGSREATEITVPEGQVFVMGDHRNDSHDSRAIGCIKETDVVGGVLFSLVPFKGV